MALGSAAALELGDGKKALAFFTSVLKYDPDQASTRQQYKKLKEVLKLTDLWPYPYPYPYPYP